jgi:periplasmic protein TonB
MFDSVLGRTLGAPGRPGLGATVSLGLHLLVLAVALHLSRPGDLTPPAFVPVHFPRGLLGGHPGAGPSSAASTPVRRAAAVRPRTAVPAHTPTVQDVAPPPADASPGPGTGEGPGQGPSVGREAGCASPPCGGAAPEGPRLLTADMQAPQLLSGPEPRYPLAAALEHVGGNLLVRCTVTAEGQVQDCVVLKSLPYLDEPVLQALSARRYRPALQDGQPVSVRMVFPVRVIPP